jgi:hypothetical protein
MDMNELTDSAIDYIYSNIDIDQCNEWEEKFVQDTQSRWKATRYLTSNQKLTLGRIWDHQS